MEVDLNAPLGWLTLESAKFGDRFLEGGDNLKTQEMLQRPVVKFYSRRASRYILVLTHLLPEIGEYLDWVVEITNPNSSSDDGEQIIPYTPPVAGDPPYLYTLMLYGKFNVEQVRPLEGLPAVEPGLEINRLNFGSELFVNLNGLHPLHHMRFRV